MFPGKQNAWKTKVHPKGRGKCPGIPECLGHGAGAVGQPKGGSGGSLGSAGQPHVPHEGSACATLDLPLFEQNRGE